MTRPTLVAPLVVALLGLAGCSGPGSGTPARTAAASAPPAAAQLATLLAADPQAAYTASYTLAATTGNEGRQATVEVRRLGAAFRLDLRTGGAVSTYVLGAAGAFACRTSGANTSCFTAPGGGTAPPTPGGLLDPGLQRVFLALPELLATTGPALQVARAGTAPRPGGTSAPCYAVSGPGVDAGTYCYDERGVLVRAVFPTGRLDLVKVGPAPVPGDFTPPVAPTPLPS